MSAKDVPLDDYLKLLREEFANIDDPVQLLGVFAGASAACWDELEKAGEYKTEHAVALCHAFAARINAMVKDHFIENADAMGAEDCCVAFATSLPVFEEEN